MGLLDDVRDLFPHTVTIAPWTGQDRYSNGTYGSAVTYQAKIERGNRQVRGDANNAVIPQYKVFIAEALQVDVRDQITLPVEFGARNESGVFVAPTPIIREVMPVYDEFEHVCTVIYCG